MDNHLDAPSSLMVKYLCGMCSESCTGLLELKEHMQTHHRPEESSPMMVDQDVASTGCTNQTNGESRLPCKTLQLESVDLSLSTNSSETSVSKLQNEIGSFKTDSHVSVPSSLAMTFLCRTCSESYTSLSELKKHMQSHHSTEESSPMVVDREMSSAVCINQKDREPNLLGISIKAEPVDPGTNSSCERPHQPKNKCLTVVNQVDFASSLPVKYICGMCSASYPDLLELKEHMQSRHPPKEISPMVVDQMASTGCINEADGGSSLCVTPIKSELVDAETASETCAINHRPESKSSTKGDQMDFTSSLPMKYLCGTCCASYTDLFQLKEHMQTRHTPEDIIPKVPVVNQRPVRATRQKNEELSDETKNSMHQLLRAGVSKSDVARVLNIPIQKVRTLNKKAVNEISEEMETYIAKLIHNDRFFSTKNLCQLVKKEFEPIQESVIRYVLLKNDYTASGYQQRRQITDDVLAQHLAWASSHLHWKDEDWGKVLWTGEAAFRTYSHHDPYMVYNKPFSRRLIWHLEDEDPTERAIRSLRTGKGSVRVWVCVTNNGVGKACRIREPLDSVKYLRILQDYMLPSAWALIGSDFIFQHSSEHGADETSIRRWLSHPVPAEHVAVMTLPPYGDKPFNPMENFFDHLALSLDGFESDDPDDLWMKMEEELQIVPVALCKRLFGTMRDRCASVLVQKGRYMHNSQWN